VHAAHEPLLLLGILFGGVALGTPRLTKDQACPTLRHVLLLANVLDCLSTPRRAQ
jgi:hypothetical protein